MTRFWSMSTWGLVTLISFFSFSWGASLQQVTNFGSNPSDIQMYIYVPDKLAAKPPIIVGLHPCGGSAQEYYSLTQLPSYADSEGFILIYPSTTHTSNCWDAASNASLTHDGGGDSAGIVSMVNYTLQKYNGDASRVFSVGSSSGAMMITVLAAAYPDVFAGCAGYSGTPAACWKGASTSSPSSSDTSCANGLKQYTAQQWGDLARSEDPGYTGRRPVIQVWAGTADNVVAYVNLADQLAQFSNVFGISFSHNVTNSPQEGYTEIVYGDGTQLVGYSAAGQGHFVPFHEQTTLQFFGLLGNSTGTTGSTGPSTTPSSPGSGATGGAGAALYGQCGGAGWTGPTTCAQGTCKVMNNYYSQCQ